MNRPPLPPHPVTTQRCAQLGWNSQALAQAVREGRVRRLFVGVYLPADVQVDTHVFACAARLVVNEDSVVCDEAAAMLHGVDPYRYSETEGLPPLTTYTLRGTRSTKRPQCAGGSRDLKPEDWTEVGGVRVTNPARTALDLACKLPRARAKAVLDALARECHLTGSDLSVLLPRYRGRRGCRQMRELLPLVDARMESHSESMVHLAILDAGLVPPEPQYWFHINGVPTYRVDFCWPRARVIVEYDGEEWHSGEAAEARDRARRQWLRGQGWTVIVLTKADLAADRVFEWTAQVRRLLNAAA